MTSLGQYLRKALTELPPRPVSKDSFDAIVQNALNESANAITAENVEVKKGHWEYALKEMVFQYAANEGTALDNADSTYHVGLRDRLDLVLTLTEHEACDQAVPVLVLQDLLEFQTITSCSQIFSWIESRSARLTKGLIPQSRRALILLRTLNDLLRRLSKTGSTTVFCGRILTFLSGVFPLSERSGVNLRGDYGPEWEGVDYDRGSKDVQETQEDTMDVDVKPQIKEEPETLTLTATHTPASVPGGNATTKPTAEATEEQRKKEFFYTFWSLQLPFSKPSVFTQPNILTSFKESVAAVIPVIKEATVKERAMMGSKAVVGTKRKREDVLPILSTDDSARSYVFAKFLTSPELLDLEIADTSFRRQVLFQLVILLSHLLQFSKTEKEKWVTPRNRSIQMDFTLEADDVKWAQETMAKAFEEMRATAPNGRAFADTIQTILERERNWVKWKNENCGPFDKASLPGSLFESTSSYRQPKEYEDYKHKLGSEALSEIWAMGYRDLMDLEMPFVPGEVKDFVRDIEKENGRINLRKQQLAKQMHRINEARARAAASKANSPTPIQTTTEQQPAPATPQPPARQTQAPSATSPLHPSLPAKPLSASEARPSTPTVKPAPPSQSTAPAPQPAPSTAQPQATPSSSPAVSAPLPESTDPMIAKAEENKHRISWLALRTAREQYLHLFGKIGNGDIILLAQEIEAEKKPRAETPATADHTPLAADPEPASQANEKSEVKDSDALHSPIQESDVKMAEVQATPASKQADSESQPEVPSQETSSSVPMES